MAGIIFPEELVKKIMVCAYEDATSSALAASTLVCRRWNAIGRALVFRRVTISSEASLERLLVFLSNDNTVISLIYVLVIRPRRAGDPLISSPWVGRVSAHLPSLLPHLETIVLDHLYDCNELINARSIEGFARFAAVHTLKFRDCSLPIVLVQALVAALPVLRRLVISNVSSYDSRVSSPPLLGNPRLESMELEFTNFNFDAMDILLPWLAASQTRRTLRSLTATVRVHGAEAFGHFLAAVGPQLDTLQIELVKYLGFPGETSSIKQRFNVGHCANLRTLQVYDDEPASAAVCACLQEVRSRRIRTIVVPLSTGAADVAHMPSLTRLGPALEAPALRGVEVCIRYSGTLAVRAVREKVQRELPVAYARGVVRVEFALF